MNFSELKSVLKTVDELKIKLPNGNFVESHFHITEVGIITKDFIDCGGTIRKESKISLQLWHDHEDHRLAAEKLLKILLLSEEKLAIEDHEIEVEYQGATIEKYGLNFEDGIFNLQVLMTDCLAPDKCVVPSAQSISQLEIVSSENTCTPGSGCC